MTQNEPRTPGASRGAQSDRLDSGSDAMLPRDGRVPRYGPCGTHYNIVSEAQ